MSFFKTNRGETPSLLIIGDIMLDKYWEGSTTRISPEAPVPVVKVEKETLILGGAANVANNIAALEAKVHLMGFCGKDEAAESLKTALKKAQIQHHLIPTDLPTIVKLRVLSQHQQLIRLDFEKTHTNNHFPELLKATETCLNQHPEIKAIILSDYGKGTLSQIQTLIQIANQKNIPVLIDPKGVDFYKYEGAYLITPNTAEFMAVVGSCENEEMLIQKGKELLARCKIQNLLLTRGAQGMVLIEQNGEITYKNAIAQEVFDVTGAGDTVIAVAGLAIAANYDLKNAMNFANAAASVVVGKVGTATTSPEELDFALQTQNAVNNPIKTGVLSREELKQAVLASKAEGDKIVFTNGCFDLLHMGHVEYLQQAKSLGDRLIIAVNSDASVKKLKGDSRPILPEEERLNLLAALSCADWVVSFDEDTPESLLKLLQPDILVKGGDYDESGIVGHEIVKTYGGKVLPLKLTPGCSTTKIIEKIIQTN
jgi:D-beta-D-heptose 7-phosphate kinase / D-beta-D-heptose 1-phosphate adenosyltransferase